MRGSRQTEQIWKFCFLSVRIGELKAPPKREEWTPVKPEKKSAITRFRTTTKWKKIVQTQDESIPTDDPIPVEPFLVLSRMFNNILVEVLQYDRCITNVVSRKLVELNRSSFRPVERKFLVQHSRKGSAEPSSKIIGSWKLRIFLITTRVFGFFPIADIFPIRNATEFWKQGNDKIWKQDCNEEVCRALREKSG